MAVLILFSLMGVSGFLYFKFTSIMLEGIDVVGLVVKTVIIAFFVILGLSLFAKNRDR